MCADLLCQRLTYIMGWLEKVVRIRGRRKKKTLISTYRFHKLIKLLDRMNRIYKETKTKTFERESVCACVREIERESFLNCSFACCGAKNLDVQIAGCSFSRINTIFTSLPVWKFVRSQAYIVAF